MRKHLAPLLVIVGVVIASGVALAGGTGHGGSCKSDSDCHKGLVCKMDKAKGHKTCQSK